jgi:hypothetical protein
MALPPWLNKGKDAKAMPPGGDKNVDPKKAAIQRRRKKLQDKGKK